MRASGVPKVCACRGKRLSDARKSTPEALYAGGSRCAVSREPPFLPVVYQATSLLPDFRRRKLFTEVDIVRLYEALP